MKKNILAGLVGACLCGVLVMLFAGPALAGDTDWILPPPTVGDWFEPLNWDNGVPGNGASADINNGGTARVLGGTINLETLQLGYNNNNLVSKLWLKSGSTVVNTLYIGNEGYGRLTHYGTAVLSAQNVFLGHGLGSRGRYVQSAGTCTVADTMAIGYNNVSWSNDLHDDNIIATFKLRGGEFTAATVKIASSPYGRGKGNVIQTGGLAHVTNNLHLTDFDYDDGPARATYRLDGGELRVDGEIVMGRTGASRLEWFHGTLETPTLRMLGHGASYLCMGRDFSVESLVDGSLLPGTTIIGLDSSVLEITNGATATQSSEDLESFSITIGSSTGPGTYEITGTGRLFPKGDASSAAIRIGLGKGSEGHLYIAGDPGTVSVTTTKNVRIGEGGTGEVTHSSGIVEAGIMGVGAQDGTTLRQGQGSYRLTGAAELHTVITSVGGEFSDGIEGLFVQDGGIHRPSQKLGVGDGGSADLAKYEMRSGLMETAFLVVGNPSHDFNPLSPESPGATGTFIQTGGTVRSDRLLINSVSKYVYAGGDLDVDTVALWGEIDFAGAALSLDFSAGVSVDGFTNAENASLTCGDFLMMVSPGYDPYTAFASFSTAGVVHTLGETLVVPEDVTLRFGGSSGQAFDVPDHVECRGVLQNLPDGGLIGLEKGLFVADNGLVDVYRIKITNATSGISSGTIGTEHMSVYSDAEQGLTGQFTQTGGQLTTKYLNVGRFYDSVPEEGHFILEGGELVCVRGIRLQGPHGHFIIKGGKCTADYIVVGDKEGHGQREFGTLEIFGADAGLNFGRLEVSWDDNVIVHVTGDGISCINTTYAWFAGTLNVVDEGAPIGRWVVVDVEQGFDRRPLDIELPGQEWLFEYTSYGTDGQQLWIEKIPEPATLSLLAAGVGALWLKRRRKA